MSNIKILLVEDEPLHALEMRMLLSEMGLNLMATVGDASSVFEIFEKEKPDLVLMDIQLKGELSGIEIAKKIQSEDVGIIFITSFNERAIYEKTKSVKNFGYIVKPFDQLTLRSIIEVAIAALKDKKQASVSFTLAKESVGKSNLILDNAVFIKKRNRLEKVVLADIEFIESDGNYCMVMVNEKKFVLKLSLVKLHDMLDQKSFVRVSKSYIINMEHISSIQPIEKKIILKDKEFSIGKAYKDEVLKKLKIIS